MAFHKSMAYTKETGTYDYPKYTKKGLWFEKRAVFAIYRHQWARCVKWYISAFVGDVADDCVEPDDIYVVKQEDPPNVPPIRNWSSCNSSSSYDPPPKVYANANFLK